MALPLEYSYNSIDGHGTTVSRFAGYFLIVFHRMEGIGVRLIACGFFMQRAEAILGDIADAESVAPHTALGELLIVGPVIYHGILRGLVWNSVHAMSYKHKTCQ